MIIILYKRLIIKNDKKNLLIILLNFLTKVNSKSEGERQSGVRTGDTPAL